jgi:hypothetical protein
MTARGNGEQPLEVTEAMTRLEARLHEVLAGLLDEEFGLLSAQDVAGVMSSFAYRLAYPGAGNVSVSFEKEKVIIITEKHE